MFKALVEGTAILDDVALIAKPEAIEIRQMDTKRVSAAFIRLPERIFTMFDIGQEEIVVVARKFLKDIAKLVKAGEQVFLRTTNEGLEVTLSGKRARRFVVPMFAPTESTGIVEEENLQQVEAKTVVGAVMLTKQFVQAMDEAVKFAGKEAKVRIAAIAGTLKIETVEVERRYVSEGGIERWLGLGEQARVASTFLAKDLRELAKCCEKWADSIEIKIGNNAPIVLSALSPYEEAVMKYIMAPVVVE